MLVVIRMALPAMYRKCHIFLLLRILVKTFHGFHRNTIQYFSAYNPPLSLKLASITLCCLFYLQHKFWFKTVSFVAAEISTQKTYQLFSPYISWNKYHRTPILVTEILSSISYRYNKYHTVYIQLWNLAWDSAGHIIRTFSKL